MENKAFSVLPFGREQRLEVPGGQMMINPYCPWCEFCHSIDRRITDLEKQVVDLQRAVFPPHRCADDIIVGS